MKALFVSSWSQFTDRFGCWHWAIALLLLAATPVWAQPGSRAKFDHLTTGFELVGQHRDLPCESCHVKATFKGTPHDCVACHGAGTAVRGTAKPSSHILSSDRCDACHTPIAWKPAVKFDHAEVRGSCSSCHNGVQAQGKGPTHIQTDLECDACHSTIGWAGAIFTHANVTDNCGSCHNNVSAKGQPVTHIPTTGVACEACHSNTNFVSFAGTTMNHTAVAGVACATCHEAGRSFFGVSIVTRPPPPHPLVAAGDCAVCHDNTMSFRTGNLMPPNHIPTAQVCGLCHANAADYSVYVMNHQGIAGNCAQCHASGLSFANMAPPVLKVPPGDHIPFGTAACESCHTASNFNTFAVTNKSPPMNHAVVGSLSCNTCHARGLSFAGTPATVVEPANHIPIGTTACQNCHSSSSFNNFSIANAVPPMNHAGFAANCIACHGAGLSFVGAPAIKALPATHIPTGSIACEGCHSSTNFSTFVVPNVSGGAPPSMVHALVTATACSACHEAGKSFVGSPATKTRPANKANGAAHVPNGECSDCHTNTISFTGATDYPANHIPLPNGGGTNCSLCHSNPGNYAIYVMDHGVVPGVACASCHASGKSFANMAPPVLKLPPGNHIPFGAAACESCHTATDFVSFVINNKSPPMNHAVVGNLSCNTCHARGLSFVGAPATVVEPANHIDIGTTACQNCHSPANFASFAIANAVPPMNHTGFTANCIACHGVGLSFVGAPPVKVFPNNHVPTGTIACEGCHSTSNFSTFVVPNASGAAPPSMVHSLVTATACSVCHEAGKSFVGSPAVKLRPALKANGQAHVSGGECGTCHFNTNTFTGATDLPGNHIPLPAADNNNCALCHTTGNYTQYVMNHVNITNNCAQCHATGRSFANMAPPALKVPPGNHIPFGAATCESCHTANDFVSFVINNKSPPMNHAVVGNLSCNTCHARGLSFVGAPATVVEPANHIPSGTAACQNCHSPTNFSSFNIANAVPPMNHTGFTTNCIACHGVGLAFVGAPPVKLFPNNHVPTGTIACEGCHSTSNFGTFVVPNASGTAPPSMVHSLVSAIACSVCHETGRSFVGSPAVKLRPALKANGQAHVSGGECSTCHFNTNSFTGATDLPANHLPLPAADNNNCVLCHTTGNYSLYVMNHVNITNNCAQCHAVGKSFANMAPPALVLPPTAPPAHIPFGAIACELCHLPNVFTTFSGTVMKHAAARAMPCVSCHERGMTWKTNTGVRLWVRPNGHHGTQDCGGSGCHSTRDKRGLRPGVGAVAAGVKAAAEIAPRAASIAGATLTRAGGFDHRRVAGQSCISCHDQASSIGKPISHLATSNGCENCHSTFAWLPVSRVDHSAVQGKCVSCHNGTLAAGKPSRHFATTDSCDSCHTTNSWTPARFDHAAATLTNCASCHDGVRAIGKPTTHIPTSSDCASCHATLAWMPVKLDHSRLLSNCASCHNGTRATGQPSTHMVTQRDCAMCHSYSHWAVISFKHESMAYPGEHRAALTCVSCHTSNTDQIAYASAANAGSCAGCHAAAFKAELHPKTLDGQLYTVSELHNCSGACHVYANDTLATISRSNPGPYHRVSDAAFKH